MSIIKIKSVENISYIIISKREDNVEMAVRVVINETNKTFKVQNEDKIGNWVDEWTFKSQLSIDFYLELLVRAKEEALKILQKKDKVIKLVFSELVSKLPVCSQVNFQEANELLSMSNDIERDFHTIKKLSDVGYTYNQMKLIITALSK